MSYSSEKEIEDKLRKSPEGFVFQMQIERARHYSDLARNYLEAAFIGQELTKVAKRIGFDIDWETAHNPIAKFTLKPINIQILSKLILRFGHVQAGNDEKMYSDFIGELIEYGETIEQHPHSFPELVDDYYANYINGEYYEYDEIDNKDFFEREFHDFPERKFGFWKCAYANSIKNDFYVSTESWIIPKESNLDIILKECSGIENLKFLAADFLLINNIPLLISDGFIVRFPFENLVKAKQCSSLALAGSELLAIRDWPDTLLNFRTLDLENNNDDLKPSIYLSEYADHILIRDSDFYYLFFKADKLSYEDLMHLSNKLSELFFSAANLAGIHVEIKCPWEQLNDETFEEICFDVIYCNPKFDTATIRKMGKSRSRDGGRDIVVSTHARPGKLAQKYIFQCKYLRPGSSLTAAKVQDISDTVIRYGATGYGIMTNVVIDATLYDKLDDIKQNFKIEIEDYSVYKLERILARYFQIKQRYFSP